MKTSIGLALMGTLAMTACGESKFKAGVDTAKPKPAKVVPETINAERVTLVTKTLELQTSSKSSPIDMIWVVDNSGSMKEEVAQVRSNIQKFVASIAETSDLRMNVISNEDDQFGLRLEDLGMSQDLLQIKFYVGSHNLMSMLAASLCVKEETTATNGVVDKICNQPVISTIDNGGIPKNKNLDPIEARENSDLQALEVAGSLASRLRPNAARVLVFVTDDMAKGAVTDKNFLELTKLDPSTTNAYAFAGIEKKRGCEITDIGQPYTAFAEATKGEVFNICETDWTANFSKLTENVIKLTSNFFEIPKEIKALKKVKIKGKELDKKQYTYAAGKLVIKDKSLLSEGDTVVVEYEVEE